MHQVIGRVVLDQHDIRDQGSPPHDALEHVVAEQGIFRDPAFQAALEPGDFVNTLADVDTLPKKVLIYV